VTGVQTCALPISAGRLAGGRFVGRVAEMAALRAAVDGSFGGQPALVMVAGEPGIGKTRLVEEAAVYARLRGGQVLWGRCYEGEAATPYSPFVEAIRDYVTTHSADALKSELGDGASTSPSWYRRSASVFPTSRPRAPRSRIRSACGCSTV